MKAILATALVGTMLAVSPALAKDEGLSAADQTFLKEAAQGNLGEVHLGDLAANKASNPAIREFGRWMISAHSFANRELTTITERMHQEAPPLTLGKDALEGMSSLEGMSGDAFDKAYLKAMIEDHKKDLAAFEKEASGGQDYLVKSFATNMVPAIREHLAEAQALQADLEHSGAGDAARKADKAAVEGGMTGPTKQ